MRQGEATVFTRGGGLLRTLRVEKSGRTGSGDGAGASTAANLAGTVQGDANDTIQRAEGEDIREGDASDEERGEQDGLHSGFISPQGPGRPGVAKTRRGAATRGSAPPLAQRQIVGIDPQRWGRGTTVAKMRLGHRSRS